MTARTYRPEIDGLRAVAVLAVVIYHAAPGLLPGGFIGVDIFFVISGYLITGLIQDDLDRGRFSLATFYARRIRRLFPALVLVLAATGLAGWFLLFPGEFRSLARHILASAFFVQNFQLWSEAGYFDVASETKPLLHLWSLAIEEQFYLLWPLLLLALWRLGGGLPALAGLGAASFALNIWQTGQDPVAAYYSPLGRAWELLLGAGLARVERSRRLPPALATPLAFLGLGLIAAGLAAIGPGDPFPGARALLPTLGCLALLAAGPAAWANARALSLRPVVWLGLISYPLYLWHWPILSYARIVAPDLPAPTALGLVVLAGGLAALTYHLVERPIRAGGGVGLRVAGLLGAMGLVVVAGLAADRGRIVARLEAPALREGDEWRFLMSRVEEFDPHAFGIYRLHDDRPRLTLFVGDSQIAQYAERIAAVQEANPEANGAVMYLGGACPPIPGVRTDEIVRRPCWPLRDEAYRFAEDPRVNRVVIGASWAYYLLWSDAYVETEAGPVRLDTPEGRARALGALDARIAALRAAGREVMLLIGNPGMEGLRPVRPHDRLRAAGAPRDPEARVEVTEEQIAVRREMLALAERTGAVAVDSWPAFCEGALCRRVAPDGTPVYSDSSHFNPAWARANAGFVDRSVLP